MLVGVIVFVGVWVNVFVSVLVIVNVGVYVEPAPANGSKTMSSGRVLLMMSRATRLTGFMVGCSAFLAGLSSRITVEMDWI